MSGPRLLLLKADRMVRAHIRSGHFIKQYQKNYQLGKQYKVNIPAGVFDLMGVPAKPVYADWVRLFDKHKQQFKSPEHVKALFEWVMRKPDFAFRVETKDGKKVADVLREKYKANRNPVVGISFEEKRGSNGYSVKTIHFIEDAQVSGKVANAIDRQLLDHSSPVFEFGADMRKSFDDSGAWCVARFLT